MIIVYLANIGTCIDQIECLQLMSIKYTAFFQYYYFSDAAQREIEDGYDMVHVILFPSSDAL